MAFSAASSKEHQSMTRTRWISPRAVAAAAVLSVAQPFAAQQPEMAYKDPKLPVAKRVDDLLRRMTLEEKIGQMTQADHASLKSPSEVDALFLGSVLSGGDSELPDVSAASWAAHAEALQKRALSTRLGIPILYGIDAVHGHSNVRGAVVFPHHIGMGCTRNPKIVEEAARVTALEISGTAMHWNFAPCIAVAQDERWGRTYESFGETAELAVMLGPAAVRGMQGTDMSQPGRVLATAKHFVGDGGTKNGVDRGDTVVDEATLRKVHMAGYVAAIKAGVGSIMVSYSSWNGQKMHGHKHLITDVLKGELGFQGLVVSDWNGIDELPGTPLQHIEQAVNAGIDMMMVPDKYREFIDGMKQNVKDGRIPLARIDDAVRRILTIKFRLGLFERPFGDPSQRARIGSAEHRAVARQAVRESQVLLVNRSNTLPIKSTVSRIAVLGKAADDIGLQCGGWTISWQGASGPVTEGTTVLQAIRKAAPKASITHVRAGDSVPAADVAVVVIGEPPYAEMKGDRKDLQLDPADVEAVRAAKKAGLPVVVILFSGRPLILEPILQDADALIAAWLPGSEGDGIADVLFGAYNPTGKLSVTWPRTMSQVPINVGPNGEKPQGALFDYGFGLRYGTTNR
jgi:beta-glucosidase